MEIEFNIVDSEYPSAETGISKPRLVKANAGQINSMKKLRPFGVGPRRPVAMGEDPSLWNRR